MKYLERKTTMFDSTKIYKTIKKIRKWNYNAGKMLTDIKLSLFEPEKYHHKPVKTANAFNNNYIQYEKYWR